MLTIRILVPKSVRFSIVAASLALAMGAAAVGAADAGAGAGSSAAPDGRAALEVSAWPHQGFQLVSALKPAAGHAVGALTPQQIARRMLHSFGWRRRQFTYLNWLWEKESSWNVYAEDPNSGAYGIPQAVPAVKMASAGPGWQTSARTQIRWGLGYIRESYGSPRGAWNHEVAYGWY